MKNELLKDNYFRNQCAVVITKTVCEYFNTEYIDNEVTFSDINDHWAKGNIEEVAGAELMTDYSDGTFRPDEKVTRAELATVLANLKGE